MSSSGDESWGGSWKMGFKIPKDLEKVFGLAMNVYNVVCSVHKDYKENTIHNTAITLLRLGTGTTGGKAGRELGAAVGSLLGPVGEIVGAVAGAIILGYVCKEVAIYVFDTVATTLNTTWQIRAATHATHS